MNNITHSMPAETVAESFTELFGDSLIIWAILGVEVFFWIFLVGGLLARYVLKRQRLSTILLIGVPVLDLVLVALTVIDLVGGATPNMSHVLAVLYLGFTVGFGHNIITKADAWFAVRFAGAAKTVRPKQGPAYVREQWKDWLRMLTLWAICVPVLLIMKTLTTGWGDVELTFAGILNGEGLDQLFSTARILTVVVVIWFVAGPVYAVLFRSAPEVVEQRV